eukprot:COSAG05_NODE_1463_length_4810_cov_8.316706_2_plen_56_part_00
MRGYKWPINCTRTRTDIWSDEVLQRGSPAGGGKTWSAMVPPHAHRFIKVSLPAQS